jgi:hypothetical protein
MFVFKFGLKARLGAGRAGVLIPIGERDFSLLQYVQPSISRVPGFFTRGKAVGA